MITQKEKIRKRQKNLFDLIDTWSGRFMLGDKTIKETLHYDNEKAVSRDIATLKDKFLIHAALKWLTPSKSLRICKVVNRNKDIRRQSDANYLEEMVLANPDSFKIKWRVGYDHNEGGVRKYVDALDECGGTTCLGVYLLRQPSKMLSSKPVRYKPFYKRDIESMGIEIDQPIPF